MKTKLFICIIGVFSFTSGAIAPSQPVDSTKINTDSLLIERAARRYIDSIITPQQNELNSLAVVIDSIKQERGKKVIIGRIDTWRGPDGRIHIWKWLYWQFPNGEVRYYKTAIMRE